MTIRRTSLITAATVLALSAVAACDDGDAQSASTAGSAPAAASPSATPSASASATPSASASSTPGATATVTPTATATATAFASANGALVDASGAFDPAVALANADRTPYAATETMRTTAAADGQESVITQSGRVNFNTPTRECRIETKMTLGDSDEPMLWMESVSTGTATFMRDRTKPGSAWSSAGTAGDDNAPAEAGAIAYAKALAAAGPAARKGMEQKNGVAAYHLGARLTADQIKAIAPKEHKKLVDKGVTAVEHDIWIDRAGRILAQQQSMKVPRGGTSVASVVTVAYSDFGPRETFPAPASAAAAS
ncbi:hypothetical protein [Kitasatospora sp. NPDC057500]|uniref:hypothetical protein n=1 Tax=Kitasatospora sp. NPDC057500 TaxID=3346151 RepID=UPI0036A3239A